MSKYSEKVAARRAETLNAIAVAMQITTGTRLAQPAQPKKPKTPPPAPRGVIVDLGMMPDNCAAALEEAAAAMNRAAAIARSMLEMCGRSIQKSEASSAALLAETTSPRIQAAATRLRRMPKGPKSGGAE